MKISISTFYMGNVVKLVKMFWLLEPWNFQIAYRHRSPEPDGHFALVPGHWEVSSGSPLGTQTLRSYRDFLPDFNKILSVSKCILKLRSPIPQAPFSIWCQEKGMHAHFRKSNNRLLREGNKHLEWANPVRPIIISLLLHGVNCESGDSSHWRCEWGMNTLRKHRSSVDRGRAEPNSDAVFSFLSGINERGQFEAVCRMTLLLRHGASQGAVIFLSSFVQATAVAP